MFVARKEELAKLDSAMKQTDYASLVYGKRRVGKTRLIKEALKAQKKKVIYYECLKGTMKENIAALVKVLTENGIITFSITFETFQDVFGYLNTLPDEFVIVIDEYPYLSTLEKTETVDSIFQNIIDNKLANISLIISGSQISIMKSLLNEGNALYGRFKLSIHLKELDYRDAAAFYPSKTPYEKIAFYGVFGGSPFVLQELRDDLSLEQNIMQTILSENSPVFLYASNLLLTDYSNAVNAERILSVLGNGRKKYSDIENRISENSNGNLAKQLKILTASELVRQVSPINRPNDAKKRYYEIDDNLLRFYYTFIYQNKSSLQMLGSSTFYSEIIEKKLMTDFVPRRFEEICRDFLSIKAKQGDFPGITNIGIYYYDDSENKKNGEFDVAVEFGKKYELYEAKYYKDPVPLDEIHREAGQVRDIKELNVSGIGFIAPNGFAEKEEGYSYYTGEELY